MNEISLNFDAVKDLVGLFKELQSIAQQPEYDWIRPILDETFNEYVKNNLPKHFNPHRYAAWRVEDNIEEAAKILDNSLDRRNEIQTLEAEALLMALELQFASQIQRMELDLETIRIRAAEQQAQMPIGAGEKTLTERDGLISAARLARLGLHSTPGGALNYGQRVTFARKLLTLNIAILYERLYAIWLGLDASFGITAPAPPEWGAQADPLGDMIIWLRTVTQQLDETQRKERVFEVCFLLGADGLADIKSLQSPGRATFSFRLTRAHFPLLEDSESIRVLGLGAAVCYTKPLDRFLVCLRVGSPGDRERFDYHYGFEAGMRNSMVIPLRVNFPEQSTGLHGLAQDDCSWRLPPLHLGAAGAWADRPVSESIELKAERQFMNAQPLGTWEIEVPAIVKFPWGSLPREQSGAGILLNPQTESDLMEYVAPKDIAVMLRVAVRKNYK